MSKVSEFAALVRAAYECGELDIENVESIKEFMSLDPTERQTKYGGGTFGHYADENMYPEED